MSKRNSLGGRRLNRGGHSTITPSAIPILREAKRCPEVSRIIIGPIRKVRSGAVRIKFKRIAVGLQMDVRGGASIQTFYIYTSMSRRVELELQTAWDKD